MLKIENLCVNFGRGDRKVEAIKNAVISIDKGDSLGIVGESGSGKSITALSIMQLLPPQALIDQGSIYFNDLDLLKADNKQMRALRGNRISMIFQEPMTSLNPVMRCGKQVTEAILQHQKVSKKQAKIQTLELFQKVSLPRVSEIYKSYPHQLSGGQKQRIMIAMAIANKPDLLIADEPTTALDVTVQNDIIELLLKLKEEYGMGLLFISHDLAVVSKVAENIAVMYKGAIVETGKSSEIFANPEHPYTRGLLACRPPLSSRPQSLATIDEFMDMDESLWSANQMADTDLSKKERAAEHLRLYGQPPLLRLDRLEKKYPIDKPLLGKTKNFVHAVDKVSLDVYPGETLGLVGESGCGKTTLGRSILRLIEPDAGKIYFEEQDFLKFNASALKKERRRLNIIFQDPYSSLNPRLSIGYAIMEPLTVHHIGSAVKERKEMVFDLLQKVGLKEEHFYRYPHEFSGGQRQRIVIARALALQPKFIICDEAVSALDVSVQAKVLNLLNDLKKEFGFTYIFISHDLAVVRYMSDRIMVMKAGKIVEAGDADEVCEHPKTDYTKQLISSIPTLT